MNIVLFVIGIVLIYYGSTMKFGNDKKISEITNKEMMATGLKGYMKVMTIVIGIGLILAGALVSCFF